MVPQCILQLKTISNSSLSKPQPPEKIISWPPDAQNIYGMYASGGGGSSSPPRMSKKLTSAKYATWWERKKKCVSTYLHVTTPPPQHTPNTMEITPVMTAVRCALAVSASTTAGFSGAAVGGAAVGGAAGGAAAGSLVGTSLAFCGQQGVPFMQLHSASQCVNHLHAHTTHLVVTGCSTGMHNSALCWQHNSVGFAGHRLC